VKAHNCEFRIEKFQLLDIMRKHVPHLINPKKRIPMPHQALMLGNQADTIKRNGEIPGSYSRQQTKLERTRCSSTSQRPRLANTIWEDSTLVMGNKHKIYMAAIPLNHHTLNAIHVRATPSKIPKRALCGLYKNSGSDEMRLMG